jgi:hypothetical protein
MNPPDKWHETAAAPPVAWTAKARQATEQRDRAVDEAVDQASQLPHAGRRREVDLALTETMDEPNGDAQWLACYCCGLSFVGSNMVAFHCHPDDRICVSCAAWLSSRSRPIARRIYPLWRMPDYFRDWLRRGDRCSSPPHRNEARHRN